MALTIYDYWHPANFANFGIPRKPTPTKPTTIAPAPPPRTRTVFGSRTIRSNEEPPLPINPKAAAIRAWLDNDIARKPRPAPVRLSFENSFPPHLHKVTTPTPPPTRSPMAQPYTPPAVRPAKTVDVARRIICHDLGVKVPKKTAEERAKDKGIRDQVKEQLRIGRETQKQLEDARKRAEQFESLKRWIWENEKW